MKTMMTKKVKGSENRAAVLSSMKFKGQNVPTYTTPFSKYVMRGGIPHKLVDGVFVPLTKI